MLLPDYVFSGTRQLVPENPVNQESGNIA